MTNQNSIINHIHPEMEIHKYNDHDWEPLLLTGVKIWLLIKKSAAIFIY